MELNASFRIQTRLASIRTSQGVDWVSRIRKTISLQRTVRCRLLYRRRRVQLSTERQKEQDRKNRLIRVECFARHRAALCLQVCTRKYLGRKKRKARTLELTRKADVLKYRRKFSAAARTLQLRWRLRKARRKSAAALKLQRFWRHLLKARRQRNECARAIQRFVSAWLARRAEKHARASSARVIQNSVRAWARKRKERLVPRPPKSIRRRRPRPKRQARRQPSPPPSPPRYDHILGPVRLSREAYPEDDDFLQKILPQKFSLRMQRPLGPLPQLKKTYSHPRKYVV